MNLIIGILDVLNIIKMAFNEQVRSNLSISLYSKIKTT